MDGVTPVSSLCRSCRAAATFNKAMVKGFVVFAGSSLWWRRSKPAAGNKVVTSKIHCAMIMSR
jgi:hypothetical protein